MTTIALSQRTNNSFTNPRPQKIHTHLTVKCGGWQQMTKKKKTSVWSIHISWNIFSWEVCPSLRNEWVKVFVEKQPNVKWMYYLSTLGLKDLSFSPKGSYNSLHETKQKIKIICRLTNYTGGRRNSNIVINTNLVLLLTLHARSNWILIKT